MNKIEKSSGTKMCLKVENENEDVSLDFIENNLRSIIHNSNMLSNFSSVHTRFYRLKKYGQCTGGRLKAK